MDSTSTILRKSAEDSFFNLMNNLKIVSSKEITDETELKMVLRNTLCNIEILNLTTRIKEINIIVNTTKKGLKFVYCYFICQKGHTDSFVIEHKFITTSFAEAPILGVTTVIKQETLLNQLLSFSSSNIPNFPLIKQERTMICLNGSYSYIYEALNDLVLYDNKNIILERYYIENKNNSRNRLEQLIYGTGPSIESVYEVCDDKKIPLLINYDTNGKLYLILLIPNIDYIVDQKALNNMIISKLDAEVDIILNNINKIASHLKSIKSTKNLRLNLKESLSDFKRTN